MSDFLNILRENRNSYSEKFRQIMISFQKHPKSLFCVFEGEDAKYYSIRIENICDFADRKHIPCNGKNDVLKLYELVNQDIILKKSNIAFFIDHDFDGLLDYTKNENLYITPCYSIENFYIGINVVKRILIDEFGVDDVNDENELPQLLDLYTNRLNEFTDAISILNAWISLQRKLENPDSKINLNGKKLSIFVYISLLEVKQKYNIDTLYDVFQKAIAINESDILRASSEFQQNEKLSVFRGKYYVEFLRIFLEQLKQDRMSDSPSYFSNKKRVKLSLSKDNILSELSQYAETPSCLKNFLSRINNKYLQLN